MNGANIYHSKFGNLETIKLRHILFPRSSYPVSFNSSDIHRPVSTQDFEFITKLNSRQIMNLLKSRSSPVWAYSRCYNDQWADRTSWEFIVAPGKFGFRPSHSMESYS